MNPIIPQDLISISKCLKSKTSQGYDNISTKLRKQIIDEIAEPLTHIFNQSFLTGVIPEQLKTANIIPISSLGTKYSLITTDLPAFSKLLEN